MATQAYRRPRVEIRAAARTGKATQRGAIVSRPLAEDRLWKSGWRRLRLSSSLYNEQKMRGEHNLLLSLARISEVQIL